MTENNKPEWFEIAENDGPTQPAKVRRSLPVAAVMAAALIIGVGAVVAQTQEEPPANATETTSVANNQITAATTSAATSAPTTAAPKSAVTPTQSAIANPNIAKLPTGGEREEDEGEHEGREHHGDRESHSEGDDD
ncbi:hypothetical protein MCERE85_00101 [Candidatus Nanopelagicaceae bacterium]